MKVRPAGPEDAREVVRLASIMYEAMGLDPSQPEWQERAIRAMSDRDGPEDRAVFVVEDERRPGHLVACGAVTISTRWPGPGVPTGRFAYIQWMVTEPEHRRRGHARALFEAILGWIRERGVTAVELHATPSGEALYRSYGFVDPAHPQLVTRLE